MAIEIIESQGDNTLNNGQLSVVGRLDNAVQLLAEKEKEFAEYLNELDRRQKEIDGLKDNLKGIMTEQGVTKLESEHLLITLVSPKPRHSIDLNKMSAIDPKAYSELDAKYGKDSPVNPYVKLTARKGK